MGRHGSRAAGLVGAWVTGSTARARATAPLDPADRARIPRGPRRGGPDAAAGLVASAADVAAFSVAIDEGCLLDAATWGQVFTPATSNAGATLPYGLGWFIQSYQGVTLQWHYGYWTTNSSLIVRAPEQGLALVVLANTPQLSAAYPGLGTDNNVLRSDVARLFVDAFILGDELLP